MKMAGEYRIPAPREAVWAALNDPDVLRDCIPGCEEVVKHSETEMEAKVKAKVGPVSANFKGKVHLSNMNPPESYTISGEGSGGAAGGAKGAANVKLTTDGSDTVLNYDVEAQITGKLAQLGQRMIDPVAKKMATQFFTTFAEKLGGSATPAPAAEAPEAAAPAPGAAPRAPAPAGGLPQWAWIGGVVAVVLVLLWVFTRS